MLKQENSLKKVLNWFLRERELYNAEIINHQKTKAEMRFQAIFYTQEWGKYSNSLKLRRGTQKINIQWSGKKIRSRMNFRLTRIYGYWIGRKSSEKRNYKRKNFYSLKWRQKAIKYNRKVHDDGVHWTWSMKQTLSMNKKIHNFQYTVAKCL